MFIKDSKIKIIDKLYVKKVFFFLSFNGLIRQFSM